MSGGRVLFIDAYDSFSNNITRLLQEELGVSTECIKIDDPRFVLNDDAFKEFLRSFDAVVTGPGPGHPAVPQDVGLIGKIWSLPDDALLPTLGICLGFQSLCLAYGARTARLQEPRHGLITKVTHQSSSIFETASDVQATQYHSLHMLLDVSADPLVTWEPSTACPELIPIAWDVSDCRNGAILMAVQHVTKPFAGVQFHPESICTNQEGRGLIRSWWRQACIWNTGAHRTLCPSRPLTNGVHHASQNGIHKQANAAVYYQKVKARPDVVKLAETLRQQNDGQLPIVLQSGCRNGEPLNIETGRFSILGMHAQAGTRLRYSTASGILYTTMGGTTSERPTSIRDVYEVLQDLIDQQKASEGPADIPVWGGLMGYVSYDAGLASIDVAPSSTSETRPDVWFVFVDRSVVIDHITGTVYIQTLLKDDTDYLSKTSKLLDQCCEKIVNGFHSERKRASVVSEPQEGVYLDKVKQCHEHLRAGQSYELCLTDQTTLSSDEDAWSIYRRLSKLNPAPFGIFLAFEDDTQTGITVVGSSPERFLSWSRKGKCQFRPIKGTVSKASGATRADAEAILRTQKEMAENLMIVDLIRHDLAGVKGVHSLRVPTLMSVEEYETVFQLVSVIEGDLDSSTSGTSVLAVSLPPGSMTGAPKRRSCELLKDLEDDRPRGLYSGVIGYLDVGGGGDFSVVIRTAFKWLDGDVWRVGAGGAVTVLSTPEGEYEEMLVKRERLLDVLLHNA